MRSLICDNVKQIAVTATATKQTRYAIFDILKLNKQCAIITESPNRSNIFYCFQYFNKALSLNLLFDKVIKDIEANDVTAKRTIIYCQTRKQGNNVGFYTKCLKLPLEANFTKDHQASPPNVLLKCIMLVPQAL